MVEYMTIEHVRRMLNLSPDEESDSVILGYILDANHTASSFMEGSYHHEVLFKKRLCDIDEELRHQR